MRKVLLGGLLAIMLIATNLMVLPATVLAAGISAHSFSYSRIGNDATILGCIGACHADLVVPSSVDGYPVRGIGPNAFRWAGLRSVVIPDSVKTIGAYAFINNPSLATVTIGNAVQSIGERSFSRTSLTAVVLGNSVRSIGDYAFEFSPIATLDLGGSVKVIGRGAFQHSFLTSVVIPDSVTAVGQQAFGSSRLASLTLGKSLMTIGELAFAWNRLTRLVIPASVSTIARGAFQTNELVSVRFLGDAPNPSQHVTLRNCSDKNGTVFRGNPNLGSVIISADKKGYLSCWDGVRLSRDLASLFMVRANANIDGLTVVFPNTKSVALDTVGQWSSLGAVTFSENDTDCDINGRTLIILQVGDGRCEVTATLAAWMLYLGATDSVEVLIMQQPDSQATATVKPTVAGTSTAGKTLTVAKGTWIGYPAPTFTYQWYACTTAVSAARTTVPSTCKRISGATRSTFKLTSAQRGKYVAVLVTGTSLGTTSTSWLSKTTTKVR